MRAPNTSAGHILYKEIPAMGLKLSLNGWDVLCWSREPFVIKEQQIQRDLSPFHRIQGNSQADTKLLLKNSKVYYLLHVS